MFRRSPPRPRVSGATLRRVTTAAAALAIAGCDASLTDPAARRPPAGPTHDEMASALLGSTTLNAPGATDWQAFATIPDDQWVIVRATGQITATRNPACDWPCGSANPVPSLDSEPSPYGPVEVQMAQAAAGTDPVPLRSVGGGSGGDAIGLQHRVGAGTMATHLNLGSPKGYDAQGNLVPQWIVTGSYTVTSTRVASPIAISEGEAGADGTRSYTVIPLYGLEFMNPSGWSGPDGAPEWYFVPGDSASPLAGTQEQPWVITACHHLFTCSYRPTQAGRVEVRASVERKRGAARSALTTRQTTLTVQCIPDYLIKGTSTTCTAKAEPAGITFAVQSWHFTGDSTGAVLQTSGDVKSWIFNPPECGTVKVEALVDGAAKSAETHVEVMCNFFRRATGDSILDDPHVQRRLSRLWQDSRPEEASNDRIEKGVVIARHGREYRFYPYQGPSSLCTSALGSPNFATGDTVVAIVHTHPQHPGDPVPTDGSCRGNTKPGMEYDDGPSKDGDYPMADVFANQVAAHSVSRPENYVVDFDHVHRYRGTLPAAKFDRNRNCP